MSLQVHPHDTLDTTAVSEEAVITFPAGLVGCADWQRFIVLDDEQAPGLHVMQSLDEPSISFLITDPRLIVADYRVTIGPAERQVIQLGEGEEAVVQCILTARGEPARVTANLLGPLAINPHRRLAAQLVLIDSPYTTRHLVLAGNS
jgi:flagellar assembly factor FliW